MRYLLKWIIYTVLVGLIPFFIRIFLYLVHNNLNGLYVLNEFDFITVALVLNVTNINELDGNSQQEAYLKTLGIGLSAFFIALIAGILGMLILSDLNPGGFDWDLVKLKYATMSIAIISIVIGGAVIYNKKG